MYIYCIVTMYFVYVLKRLSVLLCLNARNCSFKSQFTIVTYVLYLLLVYYKRVICYLLLANVPYIGNTSIQNMLADLCF